MNFWNWDLPIRVLGISKVSLYRRYTGVFKKLSGLGIESHSVYGVWGSDAPGGYPYLELV